jgi:hypothetical protein
MTFFFLKLAKALNLAMRNTTVRSRLIPRPGLIPVIEPYLILLTMVYTGYPEDHEDVTMGSNLFVSFLWRLSAALIFTVVLTACGGSESPAKQAAVQSAAATDEDPDTFGICRMLTAEQVSTVLPGHDGGMVAHSGGSMMEGVDSYQCSYTSEEGGEFRVFTLVVSIASSEQLFSKIKPSGFLYGDDKKIAIADGAFIGDKMEGEVKVTVIKGLKKAELDLLVPEAHSRSAELVELAKVVAGKI